MTEPNNAGKGASMSTATQALVIIDHGSKRPEANLLVAQVAEDMRRMRPEANVYIAHMEMEPPTLSDALAACAADGATHVVVHPFFLAPGRHSRESIAELVAEAQPAHPDMTVLITDPLGPHEKLAEIALERIDETAK